MKTLRLLLLLAVVMIFGCGKDGKDGEAYLRITWLYTPFSYWDDNSDIPYGFQNGVYYNTDPGTFNFRYTDWQGTTWTGTYKISINKGTKGELFSDGKDGADKYFTLQCFSIGPSLYEDRPRIEDETKAGTLAKAPPAGQSTTKKEIPLPAKLSPPIREIITKGNVTIELTYQRGE